MPAAVAQEAVPTAEPTVVTPQLSPGSQLITELYANVNVGQLLPSDFSEQLVNLFREPKNIPSDLPDLRIKHVDLEELVGDKLQQELVKFLETNSASAALGFKRLADLALNPEGASLKGVERLLTLVERVENLIDKQDIVRLISVREDSLTKVEQSLVEPRVSKFLISLIEKSNTERRPDLALKYLAELKVEWAQREIGELAVNSILALSELNQAGLDTQRVWPFDDARVGALFQQEELKRNTRLMNMIAELHSKRVLQLVVENNAERASHFFNQLLRFRPDPDDQNNQLRLEIARTATGDKVRSFALNRLAELEKQNALGALTKFRLALSGVYGAAIPVVFFLLIVVFSVVGGIVIFRPTWVGLGGAASERGYLKPAEAEDELSRLLKVLGLDEDSSEGDIKTAYRNLAKECHPDRLKDIPEAEREEKTRRFVAVKMAYDRILERDRSGFRR